MVIPKYANFKQLYGHICSPKIRKCRTNFEKKVAYKKKCMCVIRCGGPKERAEDLFASKRTVDRNPKLATKDPLTLNFK